MFLINVPVGAIALALAARLIPESRVQGQGRVDLTGTLLVTAGLTAIVLPLIGADPPHTHGWPLWAWLSLAAAPAILALFAVQQRRHPSPLISGELFAARGFTPGLVAQLVFWSGQASFFLVLALYLQQGRGLSALHCGLIFTILAVAYLAASVRAPALTERYGRRVLAVGALTLAVGHGLLALAAGEIGVGGDVAALVPGLILVGAGMGLGITPLATLIMSGMKPEHAGSTSGVLATAQNVGNTIGVAVIGILFFGAADHGIGGAFQLCEVVLAGVLLAVVALTRLLRAEVRS